MNLIEIIINKIQSEGPISFHDFMEMCLYYPEIGYYTSTRDAIGRHGDFYTSSSLTPAFGASIAKQLEEMWELLGKKKFTVVEYGAGTGLLCHDILTQLECNEELFSQLEYCIIEKSASMQMKEKKHLGEIVSWHNSIKEIEGFSGCVISNELIDNFAVHRVVMEKKLMEIFVDYKNGFTEVLRPASSILIEYLDKEGIVLPYGFHTEINLQTGKWISEIASSLHEGYVITIDYGYTSAELYDTRRRMGTLVCYNKHTINDDPYNNIGEQDITSHVNFSALEHQGLQHGLNTCGYTAQANFLLALGITDYLNNSYATANYFDYRRNSLLKYILLADMGNKYKVLVQSKGVPQHELTGLKFSAIVGII